MYNQFMRFPNFKMKALTFSYDDNVVEDIRLIEIFKKNGLKGTFNINSSRWAEQPAVTGRMSLGQGKDTYIGSGMELSAHGWEHLSLTECCEELKLRELFLDRDNIEKTFGGVVTGFAYPNGYVDDASVEALRRCGFEYARTVVSTEKFDIPQDFLRWNPTCHHGNVKVMEIAKTFVEKEKSDNPWRNQPMLLYIWGHSYEFRTRDNWPHIEQLAEYLGNREDIWYATNGEIVNYVQAYRRLKFSASYERVYNPSAIDVYLSWIGKDVVVPAGQTVSLI